MPARRTPTTSRHLLALLVVLALVVAACGEDAEPQAEPSPAATPQQPDPATPAPEATDAADDGAGDGAGEDAATEEPAPEPEPEAEMVRLEGITTAGAYIDDFGAEGLARWQAEVPGIQDVRIPSSADDNEQPALWLPPSGEGPQPLLVVFHTWSTPYLQHLDIPLGRWAAEMGWAMIHPNFRGANDKPEATGSDLAVQDVLDAVAFAVEQADVDEDRVYGIGFSGGGMMALLMAGRAPDRFAGVAAWTPNYDLVDWYAHHVEQGGSSYPGMIAASCGGDPTTDEQAREECLHRSPAGHLDAAREAGVPVYVAHGIHDGNVPPDQGVRAFNQVADEADRVDDEALAAIAGNRLPDELMGEIDGEHFFTADEPQVYFVRESGAATLVLFDGEHDMVYHPGLEWMVRGAAAGS